MEKFIFSSNAKTWESSKMKTILTTFIEQIKLTALQTKKTKNQLPELKNKKHFVQVGISTLISILLLQLYLKSCTPSQEIEENLGWKKIDIFIKGNIHFKNGDKIFIYNQNQKLIINRAIFIKEEDPHSKTNDWDKDPLQSNLNLKNLVTIATPEENFQHWEELSNSQNNPLLLLPQNTFLKQKSRPIIKRRNLQYEFNY